VIYKDEPRNKSGDKTDKKFSEKCKCGGIGVYQGKFYCVAQT